MRFCRKITRNAVKQPESLTKSTIFGDYPLIIVHDFLILSQKVTLIHEIFMKNPEICKESYEKCGEYQSVMRY